jgi:hypothetical protein
MTGTLLCPSFRPQTAAIKSQSREKTCPLSRMLERQSLSGWHLLQSLPLRHLLLISLLTLKASGSAGPTQLWPAAAPIGPRTRERLRSPAYWRRTLLLRLQGQEGRRFWRIQTLSGKGEQTQEPMIGQLTGSDYRTVVIVDTDGYLNGQLVDDNVLSFCYTHAGDKTQSSVVSCSEVKRAL